MGVMVATLLVMSCVVATHAAQVGHAATIRVVCAENFYGNVVQQIGGDRVSIFSIMSNPNADPHTYESSTADAAAVAQADLVVQNGLGYDAFMGHLEAASPRSQRRVIDVGSALGYKVGTNWHLWYRPTTMPRVAALIAAELARQDPQDAALFRANVRAFDASLIPWTSHIAALRHRFAGTPVAVSEQVFDWATDATGLDVRTPLSFQLAVQAGNDPSPQDVQTEDALLAHRIARVFLYDQQSIEPITVTLLKLARTHHVPIVGVYETMPPHKTYQQWMVAEMNALDRALTRGLSTETLT